MTKYFKKYTLAEKRKYWVNNLNLLYDVKCGKNGRALTKEEQSKYLYSQGFCSSSKNGKISSKFNDMPNSYKFGEIAGVKAKLRDNDTN